MGDLQAASFQLWFIKDHDLMGQEEAKEKEEKKSVVSQTLIDILEAWKDH